MDAGGNLISGVPVAISVGGSGNVLTPQSGNTSASGVFTATLSATAAGAHALSATAAGVRLTQTATVTVNAAAASKLIFTTQPSDVDELEAISPPVEVTTQDAFGNTATDYHGAIATTLKGGPKEAILFGTLSVSVSAGVATFNNLHVYREGNGYSLTASASGLTTANSDKFKVR